jgi:hypothetical protein
MATKNKMCRSSAIGSSGSEIAGRLFVCGAFTIFLGLLFSLSVQGTNHDESQYILAALFSQQNAIYKDYLYLQPPLHAVLLGFVFKHTDFGYFFVARLTSFFFAASSLMMFYLILRRFSTRLTAIVFCTVLVFSWNFYLGAARARNDMMPLLFSLIAVYLMLRPSETFSSKSLVLGLSGLLIAFAVGTKLNYVHMPIAGLCFLVLWPKQLAVGERIAQQVLPFVMGGFVGLLIIASFAAADIITFNYGVFGHYFGQYFEYYDVSLPKASRMGVALVQLKQPSLFLLSIISGFLIVYIVLNGSTKCLLTHLYATGEWLFWLIIVLASPVALLPTPSRLWYYIPIIPFYILCMASVFSFLEVQISNLGKYALLLIALLGCFPAVKDVKKRDAFNLFDRAHWTPLIVRDRSKRVDALLEKARVTGKIATLSPDKLIESKHGFYLQLATGPFFYRVASYMSPQVVERLHGASPATLNGLLEHDMPAAIFGGYERKLDNAFFDFAEKYNYRRIEEESLGKGILYIRQLGTPRELSRPNAD